MTASGKPDLPRRPGAARGRRRLTNALRANRGTCQCPRRWITRGEAHARPCPRPSCPRRVARPSPTSRRRPSRRCRSRRDRWRWRPPPSTDSSPTSCAGPACPGWPSPWSRTARCCSPGATACARSASPTRSIPARSSSSPRCRSRSPRRWSPPRSRAGRVAWDTPMATLLPWFALSDPRASALLTVGDLFAHRSGLPDHAGDRLEDLGFDRRAVLERLRLLPLDGFRDSYAYTNFGLTAAAEGVATAGGQGLGDPVRRGDLPAARHGPHQLALRRLHGRARPGDPAHAPRRRLGAARPARSRRPVAGGRRLVERRGHGEVDDAGARPGRGGRRAADRQRGADAGADAPVGLRAARGGGRPAGLLRLRLQRRRLGVGPHDVRPLRRLLPRRRHLLLPRAFGEDGDRRAQQRPADRRGRGGGDRLHRPRAVRTGHPRLARHPHAALRAPVGPGRKARRRRAPGRARARRARRRLPRHLRERLLRACRGHGQARGRPRADPRPRPRRLSARALDRRHLRLRRRGARTPPTDRARPSPSCATATRPPR